MYFFKFYHLKNTYGWYTPMDIEMLLDFMLVYQDIYVIIDTKEDDYDIYQKLVSICLKRNTNLLDRFIVQIYDFKKYIFSTYKISGTDLTKVVYYCLLHHIDVIAVPKEQVLGGMISKEKIRFLKSKNIKLFVYTVNDEEEYYDFKSLGVDDIYTDYLS